MNIQTIDTARLSDAELRELIALEDMSIIDPEWDDVDLSAHALGTEHYAFTGYRHARLG